MSKRISFKVEGVVQGVNFRAWTMDKANGVGVTGFVKNDPDGTVTGEAQGSQSALDKFVQHINTGPSMAEVSKVEQKDIATKNDETKFTQG